MYLLLIFLVSLGAVKVANGSVAAKSYTSHPQSDFSPPSGSCYVSALISEVGDTNLSIYPYSLVPEGQTLQINCRNGQVFGTVENGTITPSSKLETFFNLKCKKLGNIYKLVLDSPIQSDNIQPTCTSVCKTNYIKDTYKQTSFCLADGSACNNFFTVAPGTALEVKCPAGSGISETGLTYFFMVCNSQSLFQEIKNQRDPISFFSVYSTPNSNGSIPKSISAQDIPLYVKKVESGRYECKADYRSCSMNPFESFADILEPFIINDSASVEFANMTSVNNLDKISVICKNKISTRKVEYMFICRDGTIQPTPTGTIVCPSAADSSISRDYGSCNINLSSYLDYLNTGVLVNRIGDLIKPSYTLNNVSELTLSCKSNNKPFTLDCKSGLLTDKNISKAVSCECLSCGCFASDLNSFFNNNPFNPSLLNETSKISVNINNQNVGWQDFLDNYRYVSTNTNLLINYSPSESTKVSLDVKCATGNYEASKSFCSVDLSPYSDVLVDGSILSNLGNISDLTLTCSTNNKVFSIGCNDVSPSNLKNTIACQCASCEACFTSSLSSFFNYNPFPPSYLDNASVLSVASVTTSWQNPRPATTWVSFMSANKTVINGSKLLIKYNSGPNPAIGVTCNNGNFSISYQDL